MNTTESPLACSEFRCVLISRSDESSTPSRVGCDEDRGPVMNVGMCDTSLINYLYILRQPNLAWALDPVDYERYRHEFEETLDFSNILSTILER